MDSYNGRSLPAEGGGDALASMHPRSIEPEASAGGLIPGRSDLNASQHHSSLHAQIGVTELETAKAAGYELRWPNLPVDLAAVDASNEAGSSGAERRGRGQAGSSIPTSQNAPAAVSARTVASPSSSPVLPPYRQAGSSAHELSSSAPVKRDTGRQVVLKRSDDGAVGLRLMRPSDPGPLLVREVVPFSPAYLSRGIKAGQRLLTVDTHNVDNLSVNDVARRLQGAPGSSVLLTMSALSK